NGVPVVAGLGMGAFGFGPTSGDGASNFYGGRGNLANSSKDSSPRYTFSNTMTWALGTHSLRFGGEFRHVSSESHNQWTGPFAAGFNSYPYIEGGEAGAPTTGINATNMPGLAGTPGSGNIRAMRDMMVLLSGSAAHIRQWRYINRQGDTSWNDPIAEPALVRNVVQKEFSLFFKDDWKATADLTLNLGVRYDYFGVPYLKNGLTTGLVGGGGSLFGLTDGFQNWFQPIGRGTVPSGSLTALEWVGPGSPNPEKQLYPTDTNNFGPAVGFAYQLPFFGKGKTVLRGGYQINYIGNTGDFAGIQTNAGQAPGTTYSNIYQPAGTYLNLQTLQTLNEVPVPSGVVPGLAAFPLYEGAQDITVFAPDYKSPYIQNITFAVTRTVTSGLSVDLRYVGTLTRKNFSALNINQPNFLTNGLLEAFNSARAGGNPLLLDQLFMNQRLAPGLPLVDGTSYRGGQALRAAASPVLALPSFTPGWLTNLNQLLANGQYLALANALNVFGTPRGRYMEDNGFPINFIKANPQFNNATFSANDGHSNYHSFQMQATLRPTAGFNFQTTYTWSKNLGRTGLTDPVNRPFGEYTLLPSHRAHSWVMYGNYELPFGPGQLLGGNTSGALARIIDGWQLGWITNVQSGSPLNITAQDMLYGLGTPDLVGDFDFDSVGAYWPAGAAAGNYFRGKYIADTRDPQCLAVDASIRGLCTLQAVRNIDTGQIVFQNPQPGQYGSFPLNSLTNITRWNVDLAMSKSIRIDETRSMRIRLDSANVFNKAFASGTLGTAGTRIVFPTAPVTAINSGDFSRMPIKVGGRTFQLMMRFDF
ncbi:MAG TPA: TonB-dependent receptor, partial [Acidobacteriota bacterium]|nr:TonB-dependent receptor [Acidobacteriota bacterium]